MKSRHWFTILAGLFLATGAHAATHYETAETCLGIGGHVADLSGHQADRLHLVFTSMQDGSVHHVPWQSDGWGEHSVLPNSNDWGWQFGRPRGATTPAGTAHVVWGTSGNTRIYHSIFNGWSWGQKQTVYAASSSPGCSKPVIACDDQGVVHLAMERHYPGYMGVEYRYYMNGRWSTGRRLSGSDTDYGSPDIAVGPDGVVHVVWLGPAGGGIKIYYRAGCFSTWDETEIIYNQDGAGGPAVAVDSLGRPHVCWTRYARSGSWFVGGVFYAMRDGDGWTNGGTGLHVNSQDHMDETYGAIGSHLAVNTRDQVAITWPQDGWTHYRLRDASGWLDTERPIVSQGEVHELPDIEAECSDFHLVWLDHRGSFYHKALVSAGSPPVMIAGGYGNQPLTPDGGMAIVQVAVMDGDGPEDIVSVLAYDGYTGLGPLFELFDDGFHGDYGAGDFIFATQLPMPPSPAFNYLFSIVATDRTGTTTQTWPYLTIGPNAHATTPDWQTTRLMDGLTGRDFDNPPRIVFAGFLGSDLSSLRPTNRLDILAWVLDGEPPIDVEFYYQGIPSGVFLYDDGGHGDLDPGDGFFADGYDIPGEALAGFEGVYCLELLATDARGAGSDLWPYLVIPPGTVTPAPSATPTAAPSPSPSATPSATPSHTATKTATPTRSPTMSPTASPTLSPTLTPTLSPTLTPSLTPTLTPTLTPSLTPTLTPTRTTTATPTSTPSCTSSPSPTASPTRTPLLPTMIPTLSPDSPSAGYHG
ncbi:hypothetical protein JW905_12915 [bacterium]|nr:hypothetical protein [candidate division CSSED10-310 bacterium]